VLTFIVRVNDRNDGLRGTVEIPGGESRVFATDAELLATLYEWTDPEASGNGSGSISRSDIRDT
jgi:hypothetical protein